MDAWSSSCFWNHLLLYLRPLSILIYLLYHLTFDNGPSTHRDALGITHALLLLFDRGNQEAHCRHWLQGLRGLLTSLLFSFSFLASIIVFLVTIGHTLRSDVCISCLFSLALGLVSWGVIPAWEPCGEACYMGDAIVLLLWMCMM